MIGELRPGMATGIGSLPHLDAREASAFVLEELPILPAAPQLPSRSPAEGMVAQVALGIRGVRLRTRGAAIGSLAIDKTMLDPDAPIDVRFDGPAWRGVGAFLDAVAGRTDPIKLQVAGPITVGLALAHSGVPAGIAFGVAASAVRATVHALVGRACTAAPDARLVVFVDEPGLTALPHPDFPLSLSQAIDLVSGALASLGPDVVSGLHCCGMTDWRLALHAGPAILSAPVDAQLLDEGATLAPFLDAGGWVAWGAVPTDGPVGDDPDVLWRRLCTLWAEPARTGCDAALLRRQALVTPACGLAGHGISQARWVLRLVRELGARIEDQAIASRLSMGA